MELHDLPEDSTLDGRPLGASDLSAAAGLDSPLPGAFVDQLDREEQGSGESPEDGQEAAAPAKRGKGRLIAFGAIAAAAIIVMGVGLMPSRAGAAVKINDVKLPADPVGLTAPDFSGVALNGSGRIGTGDFKGKVVVVNFWASWCTTCKDEAAILGAVEKQWRDKGVVFLGVDSRDTTAPAQAFEAQYGMEYNSVVDPNAEIGQHFYITGFPETYFISKSGKIVKKYISAIDAATLNADIQATLNAQ